MAPYGGIAGSDGRYQKKEMIEKYLDKSSYLPRDHLTNQAISAANAAQAAAAAVAAAAAAANVTSSSNLTYGTSTFPPSSAPLLNNALASTTAYGMSGLPATNAMLEDLIEGKYNLIISIHSVHSHLSYIRYLTIEFDRLQFFSEKELLSSSLGMMGMPGMNSMMPIGGLVPTSALAPAVGPSALVDMLEIPGKGRCSVYFAR